MPSLLIAIPSKARPKELEKYVLPWLRSGYIDSALVFVERQDEKEYREVLRGTAVRLMVMPKENQGLGYVKEVIGKHARFFGYDLIFKIDDDVSGWHRPGVPKSPESGAKHFDEAVEASAHMLADKPDLAAIGFPYRNEMWEVKKWTAANARLQTCYIIKTEDWYGDKRISTFEDFAQYLHIRTNNRMTLRYGLMGIDCAPVGKLGGGLQLFDREEMAQREIGIIRTEIYPALQVKRVEGKQWKYEPHLKSGIFGVKKL